MRQSPPCVSETLRATNPLPPQTKTSSPTAPKKCHLMVWNWFKLHSKIRLWIFLRGERSKLTKVVTGNRECWHKLPIESKWGPIMVFETKVQRFLESSHVKLNHYSKIDGKNLVPVTCAFFFFRGRLFWVLFLKKVRSWWEFHQKQ